MQGIELRALRRDGSTFPADLTFSPLQTDDGLLITTVVRDITDRKRHEERIRRLNSDLERRVAARTTELTRSNEALRQFAWAASHDLQEPLRMVMAYAQMLERKCAELVKGDSALYLKFITSGAQRLDTLLSGLREYMRTSDSGHQQLEPVDCNEAVQKAIDNVQSALTSAGAVVTHASLPIVEAVPVLLVQVFQNLIVNAVKYRSAQPPEVYVSAQLDGGEWIFSVRDNGIGIHPDHHERVFGVFKRLHGNEFAGTGIGLAICKAAVDGLGGRIWVESKEGQGATFKFTLPVSV
jgi:light-regulated signal transduction histidine kinase (bacteriophytochrome)